MSAHGRDLPAGAKKIFDLSVKLGDAALIARERGDDVQALFFALKAAETLQLAKLLGYRSAECDEGPCARR
ncbi:MAG: hypothetical protein LC750_00640 [Actinobacteria bacterium]|nr:hypothetical protein [Actinomycetota bacterium]